MPSPRFPLLLAAFLLALSLSAFPQRSDSPAGGPSVKRISGITFYGNRTTREKILRQVLGIDSGDAYDSLSVIEAKSRLLATGVFMRVEVFPVEDADGVRLQVVLIESPRLGVHDVGGDFCLRYGKVADRFWQRGRARLGFSLANFRGLMERLSIGISLIEWRSLSASWYKPFLGTPWYLQLGASMSDNPSLSVPLRTQAGALSLNVGRRILLSTTVYVSAAPAVKNTQFVDRSSAWTLYNADSSVAVHDSYTYPYENLTFFEGILAVGANVDKRDSRFDPHRGFCFSVQGKTNVLLPADEVYRDNKLFRDSTAYDAAEREILAQNGRTFDPGERRELLARRYLQLDAQTLWYHRGFWRRDVFAYRGRLLLRNGEGGLLNRVSAGGESMLRGYATGSVNNNNRANNLFAGSVEYRFTIWQAPSYDVLPRLDFRRLGYDLRGFYFRFDAGVFFDGAYVWNEWDQPAHPHDGHAYAYSAGPGLRLVLPTVQHTIALDYVPLYYHPADRGIAWAWPWESLSLYLDLYF